MPREKPSQEELDEMTPEERASFDDTELVDQGDPIEDPEGYAKAKNIKTDDDEGGDPEPPAPAGDREAPPAPAADAPPPAAKPAEDGGQPGDREAPPAPAPAPAPAAPAAKPAAGEIDPEVGAAPRAVPIFTFPKEKADRLEALKGERQAIRKKFEDGELSATEMEEAIAPLEEEQFTLRTLKGRAETSEETALAHFGQIDFPKFLNDHKQYKPGGVAFRLLEEEVRVIQRAVMGRQANNNPFDPAILAEAHKRVTARIAADYGFEAPAGKTAAPGTNGARPPGERPALPPTLGGLPAAAPANIGESRFAYIDKLEGEAREEAIAKMSEADRDAWSQESED